MVSYSDPYSDLVIASTVMETASGDVSYRRVPHMPFKRLLMERAPGQLDPTLRNYEIQYEMSINPSIQTIQRV